MGGARYEGTGRSLSMKLIQQLREQSSSAKVETAVTGGSSGTAATDVSQTAKTVAGTPSRPPGLPPMSGRRAGRLTNCPVFFFLSFFAFH